MSCWRLAERFRIVVIGFPLLLGGCQKEPRQEPSPATVIPLAAPGAIDAAAAMAASDAAGPLAVVTDAAVGGPKHPLGIADNPFGVSGTPLGRDLHTMTENVKASIVATVAAGSGTRITINRGSRAGVTVGTRGMITDENGVRMRGGMFQITEVTRTSATAEVNLAPELVKSAEHVILRVVTEVKQKWVPRGGGRPLRDRGASRVAAPRRGVTWSS